MSDIDIPSSVTKIERNAFQKMRLFDVTLPDSIEEIEPGAFSESSINTLNIPESVWYRYKDEILKDCEVKEALSGKKLLYFRSKDWIFSHPSSSYRIIGDEAFAYCDIMKMEKLVECCKEIYGDLRQKVFEEHKVYTVKNLAMSIGRRAFLGCTALEKIVLPETITYIGDEAFRGCENLKEINIPQSVPCLGKNAFEGCNSLELVHISRELYDTSKGEFPEGVKFSFYEN